MEIYNERNILINGDSTEANKLLFQVIILFHVSICFISMHDNTVIFRSSFSSACVRIFAARFSLQNSFFLKLYVHLTKTFPYILFKKVCLSFADNGHTVLYLASKPIEKLPYAIQQQHNNESLRKIFFMYFSTSTDLVKKLLDIHSWNKSPKIIIIESIETFFNFPTQTYDQLVSMHTMLIATLHDCVRTFADRQPDGKAFSLTSLNSRRNDCYPKMLSIWIDLYYYKKNYFSIDEHLLGKLKNSLELS